MAIADFRTSLAKYNVAHKLYKSSLLNTVCLVAGLSIFFFGYDQGLMGGVNTTRNYAELMGFGHWDEEQQIVIVDKPLLQGGIVSKNKKKQRHSLSDRMLMPSLSRLLYTTCQVHWSAACLVGG